MGRKYYFLFLFLTGYIAAQILLMWLYYKYFLRSDKPVWLISSIILLSAMLSIVVGMICASLRKAGVAALSGLGSSVFCYVLVIALPVFKYSFLYPFFIALFSLPGLVSGFLLLNESLVLGTSFIGSFCVARGVSLFTGHFPDETATFERFR